MLRKLWIALMLLIVVPGLISLMSCAEKQPEPPTDVTVSNSNTDNQSTTDIDQAAADRQKEIDEQRIKEALRKKAEEARRKEAQKRFTEDDILFDYDSANIDDVAQAQLQEKADWLQKNASVTVIIEGHCDERGTTEYNLALGDRRASTVKTYLKNLGIAQTRITTISYGEERPIATEHNEAAWRRNRRAHFVIR